MAKIGIDIDGVLANFGDAFSNLVRTVYGRGKIPVGYIPGDWDWSDVLSKEEVSNLWKEFAGERNFWRTLEPYMNNVIALSDFLRNNKHKHDVWFVTARAQCQGDTVACQTQDWLVRQLRYTHQYARGIVLVSKPNFKRQILEGMNIDYMIDDHGPTVEGFAEMSNLKGCLLDRPWNQSAKVQHRVKTLEEFLGGIVG